MHSVREIQRPEEPQALQRNGSSALTLHPTQPLSADTAYQLKALWDQTIARYPKQEIGPLTTEMYLSEWEEMVVRYRIEPFGNALSKVLRDRARAPFFPEPHEIEAELRSEASLRAGRKAVTQIDEWKAQWMRERDEDLANGVERAPLGERPVRKPVLPAARHTDQEIAAHVAQAVTPEQAEAVRQRMNAFLSPAV